MSENVEETKLIGGKPLEGFEILTLTEVYYTDEEGFNPTPIAFFKSDTIAKAFAKNTKQEGWGPNKTTTVHALTNGKVGWILGESIELYSDEEAVKEIQEKALGKLSPEEREILGLS